LLGIRGSWWTLALVVVPVALFPTLSLSSVVPVALDPLGAVYLVGVTAIGAAWRPLAVAIDRGRPALRRLSEEPVAAPAGS
jgi:hypothetical protein